MAADRKEMNIYLTLAYHTFGFVSMSYIFSNHYITFLKPNYLIHAITWHNYHLPVNIINYTYTNIFLANLTAQVIIATID